jgi:hypothetical protein
MPLFFCVQEKFTKKNSGWILARSLAGRRFGLPDDFADLGKMIVSMFEPQQKPATGIHHACADPRAVGYLVMGWIRP